VPLSAREVTYPLVRRAYEASSLPDGPAARAWLTGRHEGGEGGGRPGPAGLAAPGGGPGRLPASRPLGDTILRRGSTREFRQDPIAGTLFAAVLDAALHPVPLDLAPSGPDLAETYLLVHAVDGLPAGAYAWDPTRRAPRLLRASESPREGGGLCLGQPLGADASAVAFFLSDLAAVVARWGNRGYRAVNLAAGVLGGRLYLGAYGLGLGATGLTFYDDDVVRFFEPAAAGRDAIFATALGLPARQPAPRGLAPAPGVLESLRPGDA
jgi:hypothetical protein